MRVALDADEYAKYFWAYVRPQIPAKEIRRRLKTKSGYITEDDRIIAKEMNTTFNGAHVRGLLINRQ